MLRIKVNDNKTKNAVLRMLVCSMISITLNKCSKQQNHRVKHRSLNLRYLHWIVYLCSFFCSSSLCLSIFLSLFVIFVHPFVFYGKTRILNISVLLSKRYAMGSEVECLCVCACLHAVINVHL